MGVVHLICLGLEIGRLILEYRNKFGRKIKKGYICFQIAGLIFLIIKFVIFVNSNKEDE